MNSFARRYRQKRTCLIQRQIGELAALEPTDGGYDHKLQRLGSLIAIQHPSSPPRATALRAAQTRWGEAWPRLRAQFRRAVRQVAAFLGGDMAEPARRADEGARAAARDAWLTNGERFTGLHPGVATGQRQPGLFSEGRLEGAAPRSFMLYEPAPRAQGRAPLLVLLHGCGQGAIEFAAITHMNEIAEEAGVVVLYPEQPVSAHPMRCWNWYADRAMPGRTSDADLIVGMTQQVIREHHIDPARVYVAGMSAGGAMAALLAREQPQIFAALGVHSGVPAGLAHDVFSALRLMAQGPAVAQEVALMGAGVDRHAVASIVFHGDEDTVVHPSNGVAIHTAPGPWADQPVPGTHAQSDVTLPYAGQHGFTRSVERGPGGVSQRELWIVHGAGHAWAGGSQAQPESDAQGPDASREMMRFFLQHRLAA